MFGSSYWITMDKELWIDLPCPYELVHYEKDHEIEITPITHLSKVLIIDSGRVRLEISDETGLNRIVYILCEGALLGEELISADSSLFLHAVTRTEVLARSMTLNDFISLIQTNLFFANSFNESMKIKNAVLLNVVKQMSFNDSLFRVSSALCMLVRDFGIQEKQGIRITLTFTHQDIADLIGVTRVSVSNAMSTLQRWGLVERKGRHISIPSPQKLEDLCITC